MTKEVDKKQLPRYNYRHNNNTQSSRHNNYHYNHNNNNDDINKHPKPLLNANALNRNPFIYPI